MLFIIIIILNNLQLIQMLQQGLISSCFSHTDLFVSVFKRQRRPLHLLQEVLPVFLVLIGRDEDDFQFVLVLGGGFEVAVEVRQAAVKLAARRVHAAAEVEADEREPAAQRVHVHLGFLSGDEPLSEQTYQELRHRRCGL